MEFISSLIRRTTVVFSSVGHKFALEPVRQVTSEAVLAAVRRAAGDASKQPVVVGLDVD